MTQSHYQLNMYSLLRHHYKFFEDHEEKIYIRNQLKIFEIKE